MLIHMPIVDADKVKRDVWVSPRHVVEARPGTGGGRTLLYMEQALSEPLVVLADIKVVVSAINTGRDIEVVLAALGQ